MKDYTFKVPQDIVFGVGSLKRLPELLEKSGSKKMMVVSDRGLEKLGVVQKVLDIVETEGIETVSFLDILPNPTVDMVNAATKVYKESGATSIVALGGGSPMDVAKAVGVLARYGGSITEYEGAHLVPGPIEPIIAIPTTAGTGSEVTAFSVITDTSFHFFFIFNILDQIFRLLLISNNRGYLRLYICTDQMNGRRLRMNFHPIFISLSDDLRFIQNNLFFCRTDYSIPFHPDCCKCIFYIFIFIL